MPAKATEIERPVRRAKCASNTQGCPIRHADHMDGFAGHHMNLRAIPSQPVDRSVELQRTDQRRLAIRIETKKSLPLSKIGRAALE